MALEVNHGCDEGRCRNDADNCFCEGHLDDKLQIAYDEGYADAKKEFTK